MILLKKFTNLILKNTFFFCLLLISCQSNKEKKAEIQIVKDDLGREITLNKKPQRFMALAPSATEMLFFVCDTAQIVAVTQNDDFPIAVKTKKIVNNFPNVDFEAVLQVKPDLIFSLEGMTKMTDAQHLAEMGSPVFFQKCEKVSDVLRCIREMGKLTGNETRANHLSDSLEKIQTQILEKTKILSKPKVLAITYDNPIYVYGKNTILTDKLRLSGAENAIDSLLAVPFPAVSPEYILKLNPDVIFGGSFGKMDSTFFSRYPVLKRTKAYQNKQVYKLTDDLNSRPSPRVMESVLEMQKILHPE